MTIRRYVGARVLRAGASLTQSRGLPSKALFGSAYMCWEAPVFIERTSVGLDVHARSVVAAAIDGVTGEVFRARLTPGNDDVLGWVRALPGPSAVVYEAGPSEVRQSSEAELPARRWVDSTGSTRAPGPENGPSYNSCCQNGTSRTGVFTDSSSSPTGCVSGSSPSAPSSRSRSSGVVGVRS